ncbi:FAD-binding domain-containing protein [Cryphonectria parasitica EP155]|uniref:FAD-binding domain-containing protein n=1 Tax=Cryphonectria parasitica (strain ATCC 38755 / EP155) TaxID=660469 RepID=A0A9P4Y542_CRYP1|nr:FAD-binding domain-containing protein [Cryphonectria parasitica EP155]KAF3766660.1 FAD-binding domain-containing protein [Cryphonectria parasitica EP155]
MHSRGFCITASLLSLGLACKGSSVTSFCNVCGVQDVRWSDYAAPQPGAIITVGTEADVATVVTIANELNVPFLLQSGGNGWADTFDLNTSGVVIDVSNLKSIAFNEARTEVTFQTGVLIEDIVAAAWDNNARVATGTCNCVSVLGAGLGGGLGRGTGLYGLGLDQLISVNYVDASGKASTVTNTSNPDLWWALKGAGPNFGIVTSAVYQSYPVAQADNTAWTGLLYFNDSAIESIISAINNLTLEAEMQLDFYFTEGVVAVLPFYIGDEATGREKFASILAIGPEVDDTEVVPYNTWNAAGDAFCADGGRKPSYETNLKTLDPTAWREVWNEYIDFYDTYAEANLTTLLTECYSTGKMLEIGDSQSAYPWRDIKCYAITIPWYTSASLDTAANDFGQKVRSILSASSGTSTFSAYVNFAHGDEALADIYGDSLSRLQTLKKEYDPQGRFDQWFPLS